MVGRILKWSPKFLTPSLMCASHAIPGTVEVMDFTPLMRLFYMTQQILQREVIQPALTQSQELFKSRVFSSWSQEPKMPKMVTLKFPNSYFFLLPWIYDVPKQCRNS